jgi:hypothetical protein
VIKAITLITLFRKHRGLTLLAFVLASMFPLLPVSAQTNWSYNPYTGGATWLGAANLLMSPLNRYSSASAPLYLADPLIWQGTYYAGRNLTNSGRQFNYGTYNTANGSGDPRQRTRPIVTDGNAVADQISHAKPFRHDDPNATNQPFSPPGQRQPGPMGGQLPPKAGQLPISHSVPLANGFIELVNHRYQGDISKALLDPETRSYAHSIGLIDGDSMLSADLNPQKTSTIKDILADQNEDPTVRINAVRLLLKH